MIRSIDWLIDRFLVHQFVCLVANGFKEWVSCTSLYVLQSIMSTRATGKKPLNTAVLLKFFHLLCPFSLTVSDIFDRIADSKNDTVGAASKTIFPLSIRSAFLNDLEDAVTEIERFILETSKLYSGDISAEKLQQLNLAVGSSVRFSLHILLLMRRSKCRVEPEFFSKTCYLYVKVRFIRYKTTTLLFPVLSGCVSSGCLSNGCVLSDCVSTSFPFSV